MPTLSELDRRILRQESTRRARTQIMAMLPLVAGKLDNLRNLAPSYVADAVRAVMESMDRWRDDEAIAMQEPPHV